jgi:hypothetical protein
LKVYIRKNGFRINSHLTRYSIKWYAHMLMHQNLCKNLEISVSHKKLDNIYADVEAHYDGATRPRRFIITVDPYLSKRTYLLAIAHEMVHVKQYATGEVRDYAGIDTSTKWKDGFVDDTVEDYYDLPWEIDAFGRERGLYFRFKDHIDKHRIVFDKTIPFDKRKVFDEKRPDR